MEVVGAAEARARAAMEGGREGREGGQCGLRHVAFRRTRADNARRKRRFGQIVKMDFGNKRRKRKERKG